MENTATHSTRESEVLEKINQLRDVVKTIESNKDNSQSRKTIRRLQVLIIPVLREIIVDKLERSVVRAERRSLLLSEDKEDVEERGEQEVKAYDDSLQKLWESFRNVQRQAEEKELEFVPLDIDEPDDFDYLPELEKKRLVSSNEIEITWKNQTIQFYNVMRNQISELEGMIKDLKDLDAGTEESYDKTEEELEKDFSRIAQEQREDYRKRVYTFLLGLFAGLVVVVSLIALQAILIVEPWK